MCQEYNGDGRKREYLLFHCFMPCTWRMLHKTSTPDLLFPPLSPTHRAHTDASLKAGVEADLMGACGRYV